MFQYTYFEKKNCKYNLKNDFSLPDNFIKKCSIEYIRTIYWCEHCLECSAPLCYGNCRYWQRRLDGSCKRFYYGIRPVKCRNTIYGAQLKLRPWGKIEARINKGSVGVEDCEKINNKINFITKLFRIASDLVSFVIRDYRYCRKLEGKKRQRLAQIKAKGNNVDTFLLQCYVYDLSVNLIFEITNKEATVIYRRKLSTVNGYNQFAFKIDAVIEEGGLLRLYPEKDKETEIVFFTADLVKLKNEASAKPAGQVKCVAWDLDNTIWDGTLIESDPEKLQLRKNILETVQELDRRGVIQIICSKNNPNDTEPVLSRMHIKEYFVYQFINWQPKSENLLSAAKFLNINIDSFMLIDDSAFERSEVIDRIPCIRVHDENITDIFHLPELDISITEESAKRRKMYLEETKRKIIEAEFSGNNTTFLRNCELKFRVSSVSDETIKTRCFELLQRTNQLNLSSIRYTAAEFDRLLSSPDKKCEVIYCRDKYGDYGQVAFITYSVKESIEVSEFAMSCRVAKKYVESAYFNFLQKAYNKNIILRGNSTAKNKLLVNTLKDIGFVDNGDDRIILLSHDKSDLKNNDIVKQN